MFQSVHGASSSSSVEFQGHEYRLPDGWSHEGSKFFECKAPNVEHDAPPQGSINITEKIKASLLPPNIRRCGAKEFSHQVTAGNWNKLENIKSLEELWRSLPFSYLTADELKNANADYKTEAEKRIRWRKVRDRYLHSDGKQVTSLPSTYSDYVNEFPFRAQAGDSDCDEKETIDLSREADYYVVIRDLLDTCPYPLPMFRNADGHYEIKCGGEITFGRHRLCQNANAASGFKMRMVRTPQAESLDTDVDFYSYDSGLTEYSDRIMRTQVIFIPDRNDCGLGIFPSDFDAKPGFTSKRKYKMASVKLEQSFDKWQYIVIHKSILSEFREAYEVNSSLMTSYMGFVEKYNLFKKDAVVRTDVNPTNATPAWKVVVSTRSYHKAQCNHSLTKEGKQCDYTYADESGFKEAAPKKKGWFG